MDGVPSLRDLLAGLLKGSHEVLERAPATYDEALLRCFLVGGDLWMNGVEPLSSEMDRLIELFVASLRWDERAVVKTTVHQLQKMRKKIADAKASQAKRLSG